MEVNWDVLSLTAWSVVIIGIVGLIIASQRAQIDQRRGKVVAPEKAADAVPLFSGWLRTAWHGIQSTRRPVGRATPEEIMSRVSVGLKIALTMGVAGLVLGVAGIGEGWGPVLFLVGVFPVCALACAISIIHSLVLRALPFRGPIASGLLGGLIGGGAFYVLRDRPEGLYMLIPLASIYGITIGIREMALDDGAAAASAPPTAAPPASDASSSAPRSP